MNCKTGITGNLYFYSEHKHDIENVCLAIGKSLNAIYWNDKYEVWAIRIKKRSRAMKQRAKQYYEGISVSNT